MAQTQLDEEGRTDYIGNLRFSEGDCYPMNRDRRRMEPLMERADQRESRQVQVLFADS